MNATEGRPAGHPAVKSTTYILVIFCLAQTLNMMDRQILNLLQESVKKDLGATDTQMGLINGIAFSVVYTSVGLPLAMWVDRGVRKNILASCLAVWSTATALCGVAMSYAQLAFLRMGVAAGEAGATPSIQSMIADMYPMERRARALSYFSASASIGILLGMLLGGWLSLYMSWRWVFVIIGLPGALLAVVVAATVREPPRTAYNPSALSGSRLGSRIRDVFKIPSASLSFVVIAVASITGYAMSAWGPTFLHRMYGMQTGGAGMSIALAIACQCLGTVLAGWLADKWGAKDARSYFLIAAVSLALLIPTGLAFAQADGPVAGIAALCAFKFVNGIYIVPMVLVMISLVGSHMRGVAAFVISLAQNLAGLGIGPFLVGALNDYFAPAYGQSAIRHSMMIAIWATAPGILAALWGMRTIRRDFSTHRDAVFARASPPDDNSAAGPPQ